ncbi:MAG: bifunctional diaminohydroxyphosphoribosylaminopyrimidine deaminase/5-amino-6-(5-phosphoribosylamino)uracil reductase RibD [Methylococcaceae bacterium]|nr:bifunctional diaminohydroxyphosphoribosylaminopyrimidine deaminase/5-amino-6-(5-phosphoribosylamino)uracil reductase RibD [Methylococcaceae bacterium]
MTPGLSQTDDRYMVRALQLARKGLLTADPNPCVGSLVVRDDRIVGEGWHRRAGGAHAEIEALQMAGDEARGATVYVTLEPCCHYGKTPPCTETLIQSGVKRVVAAMEDPNPRVAGQGFRALADAGVETRTGVLEAAARELNLGFCRRMRTGKPYVVSKLAMSLDGRTALASGESKWITGDSARRDVHWMRARSSAVVTGIGTVLADDPLMDARVGLSPEELVQPLRVVLDSRLRMPRNARIVGEGPAPLILTVCSERSRIAPFVEAGFQVASLPANAQGRLDLSAAMEYLGGVGVNQLMVEAGPTLNGALLAEGLVDEWVIYQSACVLGDTARALAHLPGIGKMSDRYRLKLLDVRAVGADLRLRYRVENSVLARQS